MFSILLVLTKARFSTQLFLYCIICTGFTRWRQTPWWP